MEAELLGFSGDSVMIRRGSKEFTVKARQFSLEDQAYIKKWISEHPEAMSLALRYSVSFSGNNGKKKRKGGDHDKHLMTSNQKVSTSVTNRGAASILKMKVVCDVIVENFIDLEMGYQHLLGNPRPKKGKIQRIRGEVEIDLLEAKKRVDVDMTFPLESLSGGYSGRVGKSLSDQVLGVIVYVFVDGKQKDVYVRDVVSGRLDGLEWKDQVEKLEGLVVESKVK